jgi:signal transduction histidine kinase
MRERIAELNGAIEISSPPGGGVEVRAEVPAGLAAAAGAS